MRILSIIFDIVIGLSAVVAGHFLELADLDKGIKIALYACLIAIFSAVMVIRIVLNHKRYKRMRGNEAESKPIDRALPIFTYASLFSTLSVLVSNLLTRIL